jgi:hypothetical protein
MVRRFTSTEHGIRKLLRLDRLDPLRVCDGIR